jgi:STE24 endopeptidase
MRVCGRALAVLFVLWPAGRTQADTLPPFDPEKAALAAQVEDPAAATRAYLEAVPADRRARTKAYAHGNYLLDLGEGAFSLLVLAALLGFGVSARVRDRAERLTRRKPLQTTAYFVPFLVITTLAGFPLTLYRSFLREKAYGLLTQGFADWLLDRAKGLGLGAVIGSLALMALYGVLRRFPRAWWILGAAVMVAFLIVSMALGPVFIAPLFNKFEPVKDAELREEILAMAQAKNIPAGDVFETDISRRSDRITAYVAGALGTTRIVMGDTTLKRCTRDEIRMIMAHEMGHYVLDHIWKLIGLLAVTILLGFLFLRSTFAWASARWPRMGVRGIGDVAGLPLLLALLSLFMIAVSPALNSISRHYELEADVFGLEASRAPDAAATTFLKLGEYRDLDPHPLVELLLYDHPSGRNRIRIAMEWKRAHGPRLADSPRRMEEGRRALRALDPERGLQPGKVERASAERPVVEGGRPVEPLEHRRQLGGEAPLVGPAPGSVEARGPGVPEGQAATGQGLDHQHPGAVASGGEEPGQDLVSRLPRQLVHGEGEDHRVGRGREARSEEVARPEARPQAEAGRVPAGFLERPGVSVYAFQARATPGGERPGRSRGAGAAAEVEDAAGRGLVRA